MIPFAHSRRAAASGFSGKSPIVLRLVIASVIVPALLVAAPATGAAPPRDFEGRAEVRAFIDEMTATQDYDRAALVRAFRAARYQRDVITAMQRPLLEPPKWYDYARPFLAPARIDAGVDWWNAHADVLSRAELEFGVPPEVIVAIIGVETDYGRNLGRHRAFDALATLAFDYPRRAAFFRAELRDYLLLTRALGVPPRALNGSFAGALGVPQFMPGSYRSFAVDFDGDGRIDLWKSPADIVGSVANFLARHDWQPGQPALLPAVIAPEARDAALRKLDGGISERRALDLWAADGVAPADPSDDVASEPVGLLMLEERGDGPDAASFRIACHNFYVLTRYNRSRLYAAAVWDLAQAIKAQRGDPAR
jgi:membrane-bound lytic murein transglycosylase B